MLANGLGYKKIIKKLKEREISISKGTLYYWCNKETKRFQKNSFTPSPSKELSYFIGVMFGDGCATEDKVNYDYSLRLDSIDKEFVEKFAFCVSKLLKKEKSYPIHKCKHFFSANIRSKELHEFVKEIKTNFDKAKPFIEESPADFIQGVADSEGCPDLKTTPCFNILICIANSTNYALLEYTKKLLKKKFLIDSKIYLTHESGETDSIINGRIITRTKDLYKLNITDFSNTKIFHSIIGFSIKRKQEKLKDAITIKNNYSNNSRLKEWKKLYKKLRNGRWKKYAL